MKIENFEYENLVRDSEKLRIIETLACSSMYFGKEDILRICGYADEEKVKEVQRCTLKE